MKVSDIMTAKPIWCRKDTDLGTAARMMLEGRLGSIPVVDEHGQLNGILTDRDVAMAVALRRRQASNIAVHEAMAERVHTCSPDEDVRAALKRMATARVRRLPVVTPAQHLVGILSIDDIVLRAIRHPDGVTDAEFVDAMGRICAQPPVEPELENLDVFLSG
jgi:CBS domain-containing protein